MNKNTRNVGFAFMVVGVLLVLSLFSGLFSIDEIINDRSGSSYYSTVNQAFSACNADRADVARSGGECDDCALACPLGTPLSGGSYDFSYPSSSSIYEGSWTNLDCDYVGRTSVSDHDTDYPDYYRANGNILSVRSYCHDSIRVCNKPVGSPSLIDINDVPNGVVKKYRYTYGFGPCDGSDTVTGSTSTVIKYRLVCDSNFYVDGDDFDEDLSDLGSCSSIDSGSSNNDADDDSSTVSRGGVISDVRIGEEYVIGEQISVRGKFEASGDGIYLIGVNMDDEPSAVALSVVTGSATFDQCSNDLGAASNFFNLNDGDLLVFSMVIQSPDVAGDYDVNVFAQEGCSGNSVYDSDIVSTVVIDDSSVVDDIIDYDIIDDLGDDYDQFYDDLVDGADDIFDEIDNQGGCEGVDLSVDGCIIAECVDNIPVLLDDVRCFEVDADGNFDADSDDFVTVEGTSLQEEIADGDIPIGERLLSFSVSGLGFYLVGGLLLFIIGLVMVLLVGKKK